MRFSKRTLLWVGSILAILNSGCGIFGKKDEEKKILEYAFKQKGCLNELGPSMERYLHGFMQEAEWVETWDCTIASLRLFKQFVKRTNADGFTPVDIHAFISNILVTDKSVSQSLIDKSFELKASIFGGSDKLLTDAEMDRFIEMLEAGKTASTKLIPHLHKLTGEPTSKELLALSDAISDLGVELSLALKTQGHVDLRKETADLMVQELRQLFGWKIPARIAAPVFAMKAVLVTGNPDVIEGELWPRIFRVAGAVGGPVLAAMSLQKDRLTESNELGRFLLELASRLKTISLEILNWHEGALSVQRLDRLIDSIPEHWLGVSKSAIKKTFRPLMKNVLWSSDPEKLEPRSIELAYHLFEEWSKGQTHLETIFDRYHLDHDGISAEEFVVAAKDYAAGLDAAAQKKVERLRELATEYPSLFLGNDTSITIGPTIRNSLHNLTSLHWMNVVSQHLMNSYSSQPNREKGSVEDLGRLVGDFYDLGEDLGLVDREVQNIHKKRHREMDLFTYRSNGDGFVDVGEVTNYIAVLISSITMSGKMRDILEPICRTDDFDVTGKALLDVDCFRREYFARYRQFWDHFPLLVKYYDRLSNDERVDIQVGLEVVARRYGYTDLPVGNFDVQGFPGGLHFIETVFSRFDFNGDEMLDVDETLRAYPTYRKTIMRQGCLDEDDNSTAEAAFTYIVRFGKVPSRDIFGGLHFLMWKLGRPFWSISAERRDLYKIVSLFVPPAIPGQEDKPEETCD